ncbi:M-phase phosphoprotein 8 isoform X3 [Mastacembelus armatus]|uniref:M-phase phosphoprotein 8 isoform X3 n=1 Tax=Mastacembelus armatus TaxID=205130 RepID=UPI000E457174|nr:M-phase phosphoprotein 8 isoform X3 [Mastacembelus armatus]
MAAETDKLEPADSEQDEEEDVYEVERIIDMRVEEGEVLYRVRWKNYCSDDDTWEPEAHLEDCREVLLAFKKSLAEAKMKKESEAKRPTKLLPTKNDLFDAESDSDSNKDLPTEAPVKKKKKKKIREEEDDEEEEEPPLKDKRKKKKKDKRREDVRPLPAPETDDEEEEEEEKAQTPPSPPKEKKTESKKRLVDSEEDDDEPVPSKKHKKEKGKEGGKFKKERGEDGRKKKGKKERKTETSEDEPVAPLEDDQSNGPSDYQMDDAALTDTVTKSAEKARLDDKSKQKKGKSEIKLQGIKDLIHDKKGKKPDAVQKESSLQKLKSPTSKGKEEAAPHSDSSDSSSLHKKTKSKAQESTPAPPKALSSSSSSSSSVTVASSTKVKEEEVAKEDVVGQKDATGSTNLFAKFLLNCEAKDRAPRRQPVHQPPAEKSISKPSKLIGKIEKIPKTTKESPAQKAEPEKTERTKSSDVPRPGQSYGFSLDSDEKEGEETTAKPKPGEDTRERRERPEEAARPGWERRTPTDDRRKRREDSEPRLFMACDDNQDVQDPPEVVDKSEKGQATLSLGMDLNLDWMTLDDFQKHLNGEDEILSGPPLSPTAAAARSTEAQKKRASHLLPGTMEKYNTSEDALPIITEPNSKPAVHDSVTSDSDSDTGDEKEEYHPGAGSSSTESSDDEEGELLPGLSWWSKNGEIHWAPTNSETFHFNAPGTGLTPGPTRYARARIGELSDSFDLFFTTKITKLVTEYTNLHGRRIVPEWKDLDATTMRAYFGLLLLAGVYRSRTEPTRNLWDDQAGRHIFRATMSVKTFVLISRMLHFDDRLSRPQRQGADKLAAVREIWDLWTAQLPLMFNPAVDICVDEQVVPYQGICEFQQYMPMKPANYGLKLWVTCDVITSYAWKISVYTGPSAGSPAEQNERQRVVLDMVEGLTGVNVTCDHFFSSFGLAEELLRREITMVGTMRKKRPELPPQLLRVHGREVFSSIFAFTSTHTLVSYLPKRHKNVVLLSTKHRMPKISSRTKRKPQMMLDYNRCKGGVDTMDKMISTYSCRRKTKRWPLALFFNMLDISAFNAYIVWTAIHPGWHQRTSHRRRLFLHELGKKLITPHMTRRQHLPQTPGAASLVLEAQAGSDNPPTHSANPTSTLPTNRVRKQCALCPTRRVVFCNCKKCGKHVCKEHYDTICSSCLS